MRHSGHHILPRHVCSYTDDPNISLQFSERFSTHTRTRQNFLNVMYVATRYILLKICRRQGILWSLQGQGYGPPSQGVWQLQGTNICTCEPLQTNGKALEPAPPTRPPPARASSFWPAPRPAVIQPPSSFILSFQFSRGRAGWQRMDKSFENILPCCFLEIAFLGAPKWMLLGKIVQYINFGSHKTKA